MNKSLDLADVAAPDEVAQVLRAAAEQYYESHNELLSAWQQSYTPWARIARLLEQCADKIDKDIPQVRA
jgi:hypothetical protein